MKLFVETTGQFQIHTGGVEQWVRWFRPSVVRKSNFIETQIANKNLTIICEVPPEATDDEFAGVWEDSKGDYELAVAAFRSMYEDKPAPRQRKGKVSEELPTK